MWQIRSDHPTKNVTPGGLLTVAKGLTWGMIPVRQATALRRSASKGGCRHYCSRRPELCRLERRIARLGSLLFGLVFGWTPAAHALIAGAMPLKGGPPE